MTGRWKEGYGGEACGISSRRRIVAEYCIHRAFIDGRGRYRVSVGRPDVAICGLSSHRGIVKKAIGKHYGQSSVTPI